MREVNIDTWPRKDQFRIFNAFDYPHFGLCANVDLTYFYPAVQERNLSFTIAIVFVLARAANDIPEFRYRIRSDIVVEHEIVHPSFTVITEDNLFSFCTVNFDEKFSSFAASAVKQIERMKKHPKLEDEPGQDDLLFMSAIPWVSFTSFMHPIHCNPVDSVPRLIWGKFFKEGTSLKMPLGVQGHHALMDGFHVGTFYSLVQKHLKQPTDLFV